MEKFACITGADRGLGFELTKQLLGNGYTVFAGRYMKDWGWLDELKSVHGDRLELVDLDISDSVSVKAAGEYIKGKTERLDVLVNNAALGGGTDNNLTIFDELNFEKMQELYNVNTLGALRVTNELISLVVKSDSKLIVNISSEAGSVANCDRVGWFGYCMSKTALNMQSAIIHNNLKEMGGQVLVIHPGWMRTYMGGRFNEEAPLLPEIPAENIMKIIVNHEKYKGDKPAYIDHQENKWPW